MSGYANLRSGLATGGVSLCFLVSAAVAQECEIRPMTDSGDRTAMAQSNFTCVSSRLSAALSRVESLEADLAAFRAPRGMVAAFNRDKNDPCPRGWKILEEAGGRFVVGAGNNTNKDVAGAELSDHPSLKDEAAKAVGGEELHKLAVEQLPPLSIPVSIAGASTVDRYNAGGRDYPVVGVSSGEIHTGGRGDPFSIMPPFVALYFCAME